jgi:hypothetical protein
MRKEIIGLIGSIAVNIVLAAAGLLVKGDVLLYAGTIGLALTAILWIWSWAFAPSREAVSDKERRSRRRKIINEARSMDSKFELQERWSWRDMVRYSPEFAPVRPHLSTDYLNKLNDVRTAYAGRGLFDPLAGMFLDELDRLEREWELS